MEFWCNGELCWCYRGLQQDSKLYTLLCVQAKYILSCVYRPICEATVTAPKPSWICDNVNSRISPVYTNRPNICHGKQLFLLGQMIHVLLTWICPWPMRLIYVRYYPFALTWHQRRRKNTIFPGMRKVNPLAVSLSIKLENLTVGGMASVRTKGWSPYCFITGLRVVTQTNYCLTVSVIGKLDKLISLYRGIYDMHCVA